LGIFNIQYLSINTPFKVIEFSIFSVIMRARLGSEMFFLVTVCNYILMFITNGFTPNALSMNVHFLMVQEESKLYF